MLLTFITYRSYCRFSRYCDAEEAPSPKDTARLKGSRRSIDVNASILPLEFEYRVLLIVQHRLHLTRSGGPNLLA